MKKIGDFEQLIRYIGAYILMITVYLFFFPFIVISVLFNFLGQVFNNASKILNPNFNLLNDVLFAIINGCSKKKHDEEMASMINKFKDMK